jgi:hypothetical protein
MAVEKEMLIGLVRRGTNSTLMGLISVGENYVWQRAMWDRSRKQTIYDISLDS